MHTVFGDHHYGIILKKRTTNGVRKQTAAAVVAGFGAGSDGLLTGEALVEEEEAEASEVEDGSLLCFHASGDVLFQVSGLGKLSFCNHRRDKGMMDLLYGCGWFVG